MADEIKPRRQSADWIAVYITYQVYEAYIVAGRLQSEGIPAMVDRVAGADAMGIFVGSLGEIKVLVHTQNYERALAILDQESCDLLPDSTDPVIFPPDEEDEEDDYDE